MIIDHIHVDGIKHIIGVVPGPVLAELHSKVAKYGGIGEDTGDASTE